MMTGSFRYNVGAALILCTIPMHSFAVTQQTSAQTELLFAGAQTVVTAARIAQPIQDSPSAVTIITADQIRRWGAVTILDALRYVPGLDVSEANQTVANVTIRGFNSQYTGNLLVMIDGRSIYQDFFGGLFWQQIPISLLQIKRIEIVRGPGSALYGANAFNGVINIITKTPKELAGKKGSVEVKSVLGGYNTDRDSMVAAFRNHSNAVSVTAAYHHTSGYGSGGASGVKDGYNTSLINLDAEHSFRRSTLRLQTGYVGSEDNIYEDIYLNGFHTYNSFASLAYDEPKTSQPVSVRLSYNNVKQTSLSTSYGHTETVTLDAQQQIPLCRTNQLLYGMNVRTISFRSDITGPSRHYQNLFGLFLQDEAHLSHKFTLFTGLRFDTASLYGSSISPRVSLLDHLHGHQTVRFSYGVAYVAPDLLSSYADVPIPLAAGLTVPALGNLALSSQKMESLELGWRKELKKGFVGFNSFYNWVTGFPGLLPTGFQPSPPYPPGVPISLKYQNLTNAVQYGFELESDIALMKNLRGIFNYSYDMEHIKNSALSGSFTPQHMINMALDANLGSRWEASLGAHFAGGQTINSLSSFGTSAAFLRMDMRLAYKLRTGSHSLTLAFMAHNLFGNGHVEMPITPTNGLPAQIAPQPTVLYMTLSGRY